MKVYEIEGNSICAQTDRYRKVILINKNLRKYPKMRAFIIRHEKQHLKDNSYFKALLLDFKDYPVLYSRPEFWEFHHKYVGATITHQIGSWIYTAIMYFSFGLMGSYYYTKFLLGEKNGKH